MVDGLHNSVVESDIVPLPNAPVGSPENFAGNAFVTEELTLTNANHGARDYSFERDRRWRIVNPTAMPHYSTGLQPGYVINAKGAMSPLMAREGGWVARRAAFAKKALWVVKEKEGADGGRVWPAGKYVPQTRDDPEESLGPWSKEDVSIDNEDIVVFLTLGWSSSCFLSVRLCAHLHTNVTT